MPLLRELPDDLVRQLCRARLIEHEAGSNLARQRNAVAATGTLMLAAVDHGWLVTDLARVLDLQVSTASARVRQARRRRAGAPTGLILDRPVQQRSPLAELKQPADNRDWLSRAEAARYLDVAARTIGSLHTDGLLPNTRDVTGTWRLYLRADLDRVRNGPRRGRYLDRAALRLQMTLTR